VTPSDGHPGDNLLGDGSKPTWYQWTRWKPL